MAFLTKFSVTSVLLLAILYQTFLKSVFFVTLGYGREMQPISDFASYTCRRIVDPKLSACEDMWLSEATRTLFLACSDPAARKLWLPNLGFLNATGRSMTDSIVALKLDRPVGSSFEYNEMPLVGYPSTVGDYGSLHLVGLTGKDVPSMGEDAGSNPSLLLVNAKPFIDPQTKNPSNSESLGANMTIELFTTDHLATELQHQQTFHSPQIRTPNNVAFAYGDGFFYTNDHGTAKSGWQFAMAPLIGNGDVSHCGQRGCKEVVNGLGFPNGLLMGMDGLLYVPSAFSGGITVYKVDSHMELTKVDFIDIPYPLDNLSQDRNGDIWAAAIPKLGPFSAVVQEPYVKKAAPATIFRVRKRSRGEWEITKVLEDRDAEILPGATVAVHDATTGRVFVSGIASPFITVCENRK